MSLYLKYGMCSYFLTLKYQYYAFEKIFPYLFLNRRQVNCFLFIRKSIYLRYSLEIVFLKEWPQLAETSYVTKENSHTYWSAVSMGSEECC